MIMTYNTYLEKKEKKKKKHTVINITENKGVG